MDREIMHGHRPSAWEAETGESENSAKVLWDDGSVPSSVTLAPIVALTSVGHGSVPHNNAVVSTSPSGGKACPATVWYTVPVSGRRGAIPPHTPRSEHSLVNYSYCNRIPTVERGVILYES